MEFLLFRCTSRKHLQKLNPLLHKLEVFLTFAIFTQNDGKGSHQTPFSKKSLNVTIWKFDEARPVNAGLVCEDIYCLVLFTVSLLD